MAGGSPGNVRSRRATAIVMNPLRDGADPSDHAFQADPRTECEADGGRLGAPEASSVRHADGRALP